MAKLKLRGKDLRAIGYPEGPVISIAMNIMEKNYKFDKEEEVMNLLKAILASPVEYTDDAIRVDIGCRMCLSVFDIDPKDLVQKEAWFARELKEATLFGSGRQRQLVEVVGQFTPKIVRMDG